MFRVDRSIMRDSHRRTDVPNLLRVSKRSGNMERSKDSGESNDPQDTKDHGAPKKVML